MLSVNWARDLSWQRYAACKGHTDEFYPEGSNHMAATRWAVREYCDRCPVRIPCLEWALTQPEEYGIWGGHDIGDRKRMQGRGRPLVESTRGSVGKFPRAGQEFFQSEVHVGGQEHR